MRFELLVFDIPAVVLQAAGYLGRICNLRCGQDKMDYYVFIFVTKTFIAADRGTIYFTKTSLLREEPILSASLLITPVTIDSVLLTEPHILWWGNNIHFCSSKSAYTLVEI